jgi:hypothetical protein
MRSVSSTRGHDPLDFLAEHDSAACDGHGWASPTGIGINHPDRADEEGGSDHTGTQRDTSLRERTGYRPLVHAPAEVVRYPDHETDQDMERGTEAMVFSGVALKLPEIGLDLRASSLTTRR